ncbi:MAG: hypothetical protein AAGB48_06805 [Planctomycetota bacterium]
MLTSVAGLLVAMDANADPAAQCWRGTANGIERQTIPTATAAAIHIAPHKLEGPVRSGPLAIAGIAVAMRRRSGTPLTDR